MVLLQKRPTIANELTLTRFHNNHASQASAGWIDVIAVPRSTDEGAQNKRNDDGGAQNKRNDRWFVYKNERVHRIESRGGVHMLDLAGMEVVCH